MRFGRCSQSLGELGEKRSNLRLGCARAQDRPGQGDSSGGHEQNDNNYPRGLPLSFIFRLTGAARPPINSPPPSKSRNAMLLCWFYSKKTRI
jgi:hypothetical protein